MKHLTSLARRPSGMHQRAARLRRGTGRALLLASALGCNAVLGIEEAELCGGGSCDGGPLVSSAAPSLPGADAGGGQAGAPSGGVSGGQSPSVSRGADVREGSAAGDDGFSDEGPGGVGGGSEESGAPPDESDDEDSSSGLDVDDEVDGDADDDPPPVPGDGDPGNGTPGGGPPEPEPVPPPPPPPPPPTPCDGRAVGEAFCSGATRIACGPGGVVASALDCPSQAHCAQGAGPACAVCLDGEASCEGASLFSCNATRTAIETQDCGNAALCNAAAARCEPAVCAPGAVRCSGSVLEACTATLTGFAPVADCGAPEACNAEAGSCNLCAPGARRCLDEVTVGECEATGQAEVPIGCGLLEVCAGGECVLGLPGLPSL